MYVPKRLFNNLFLGNVPRGKLDNIISSFSRVREWHIIAAIVNHKYLLCAPCLATTNHLGKQIEMISVP